MEHRYNKKQWVRDLCVKDHVEEIFLVKSFNVLEGKDGRSYGAMNLTDTTGTIDARLWQDIQKAQNILFVGALARIEGKINQFQGKKQLIISHFSVVDPSRVSVDDFYSKAEVDPQRMMDQLEAIVANLGDVYIKKLLSDILLAPEIRGPLFYYPAGKTIHHAYQSGLLEHILSCTNLAVSLSRHYNVNENFVVAGAILHDLAKIYELTSFPSVEYTDEGKLIGHLPMCLEIIDKFANAIPEFPRDTKMHLKHIVLAHHGELEYGSPKVPMTSEAYLVHLIDFMDSKMNSLDQAKKGDTNSSAWTHPVRHLNRSIYRFDLPFYGEEIKPQVEEKEARETLKGDGRNLGEIKESLGKHFSHLKIK